MKTETSTTEQHPMCSTPHECKSQFKLNAMGAGISLLCLIHCLAPTLAIGYLSVQQGGVYHFLDYFFLTGALGVIYLVTRKTPHTWMKTGLWAGMALISGGLVVEHFTHSHVLFYIGSGTLVILHTINLAIHWKLPGFRG